MTTVSIMITTRNRSCELLRTLQVLRSLEPSPFELIVTVDGCSDDTVDVLRREWPEAVVIVNSEGRGSVASRATMMQKVTGDLVLALDDDSYPEQVDCLQKLIDYFEANPNVAIATFPQRTDEYPETLKQEDFGVARPIRSFPNSGACLRVSTYRDLPGFEPMFFHMYEEPDYALQCVANGWKVLYDPEITIRHYWTPNQRSEIRNHHLHARNEFWSTVMRCPFPHALGLMGWRLLAQARFAAKRGLRWLVSEPIWWWQAFKGIPKAWLRRNPVTWSGYRRWLELPDE